MRFPLALSLKYYLKNTTIHWECSGAYGAHAYVFILRINDGEEFAVKKTRDLNFNTLGDSANALLNHSIQGVVPLWGIDSMVTKEAGEGFHLITMNMMQDSVHNFKKSLCSKNFKECLRWCFSSVEINVCDEAPSERMNISQELNKWTLDVTSRCPPPSPRSFFPELQSKRDEILRKLDD